MGDPQSSYFRIVHFQARQYALPKALRDSFVAHGIPKSVFCGVFEDIHILRSRGVENRLQTRGNANWRWDIAATKGFKYTPTNPPVIYMRLGKWYVFVYGCPCKARLGRWVTKFAIPDINNLP